jgi:hypothetical protein
MNIKNMVKIGAISQRLIVKCLLIVLCFIFGNDDFNKLLVSAQNWPIFLLLMKRGKWGWNQLLSSSNCDRLNQNAL